MNLRFTRRLGGPRVAGGASLLSGVQAALETRLGESLASPELGVLDFAAVVHEAAAGAEALARSVRAALTRHEPRLCGVAVRALEAGALCHSFELRARVQGGRERVVARLELSPCGRLRVSAWEVRRE